MRAHVLLSAAVLLAVPISAHAQSAQGDVALTIYNNNSLALIQDTRQLNLPAGRSRQEFPDVSATIRPETVTLAAAGTGIVEQNFDFDLLTPEKLLDKAVGQTVTLVRTNPATGAETREMATVLANNGGTVLRIGSRIEVLNDRLDGRIIFPSLPPNLRARPTLSVTLEATSAGPRPATLTYLSNGFAWQADYVALFDDKAGKLDMQGWITLTNNSGTSFENAKVLLVAGSPGNSSRRRGTYPPPPPPPGNRPGTESAARERLGDFYLYPIARRSTVANAQQKQVSFLDVAGVPAARGHLFRNEWLGTSDEARSADTVLSFSSSRNGGLGDALPAGTIRVYMSDGRGQPQFIGENRIDHTPMGSKLAIRTGEAFDVKVKPTVESRDRIDSNEWERSHRYRVTRGDQTSEVTVDRSIAYWRTTMSYKVSNARPEPVTVEIVQAGLDWGWRDTRVPSESITGEQRSPEERAWLVPVPANGETVLTVQFDTRY